jgi:hypothetical protein
MGREYIEEGEVMPCKENECSLKRMISTHQQLKQQQLKKQRLPLQKKKR